MKFNLKNCVFIIMACALAISLAFSLVNFNEPTEAAVSDQLLKFINVSGSSYIKIEPDIATISLGVTTSAETSRQAQEDNAKLMNAVIAKIKEMGIDEKDIQTSNYSVYPQYSWNDKTYEQSVVGYQANYSLSVIVRNIDNVGKIFDAAIEAGANNSGGITFDSTKRDENYLEALTLAIYNAEDKAKAMAIALGNVKIEVLEVSEGYSSIQPYYESYSKNEMMDSIAPTAPTTIQSGEMSISANVSVKYSFVK